MGGGDNRSAIFAGLVLGGDFGQNRFVFRPGLAGGARTPTPHAFPNVATDPQYSRITPNDKFNFGELTPAIAAVDREYFYGSLDRKVCDQYLELLLTSNMRAPSGTAPWRRPHLSLTSGPTQLTFAQWIPRRSPASECIDPFTVPDYVSPGDVNPLFPQNQVNATTSRDSIHYRGRLPCFGSGPAHRQDYDE